MATRIAKKTAELMMAKLKAKLDALYSDQESHPSKQPNQMMTGQKFGGGGRIPMYEGPYGSSTVNPFLNYNIQNAQDQVGDYSRYHNVDQPAQYDTMTGQPIVGYRHPEDIPYNLPAVQGKAANDNPQSPVSPKVRATQPSTQGIDNGPTEQRALAGPYVPKVETPMALASYGDVGGPTMGLTGSKNASNYDLSTPNSYSDAKNQGGSGPDQSGMDWAGIAGGIASFAPGLYNLANAFRKPEVERPQDYYNPQYNNAMSLMRNRRFDVRPLLEQNLLNQNTYNRNLRNTASSRGELMSNMAGGYGSRLRADSGAYATKSQMDAGYRGEEAQMRAQLGQQRAQTNMQVGDWNARNRAAQRNYGAAAATNIGDVSSMLLRNRNMKSADQMRTEAMSAAFPYLKEWMPGLEEMFKKYNTQSNGK